MSYCPTSHLSAPGATPGMPPRLPQVIGLYSPVMGSGKTEIATFLCRAYGYTLVKFAGPLKAMTRGLLYGIGIDNEIIDRMIEGDLKEKPILDHLPSFTPRRVMQTLGTEWGRNTIAPGLWVDLAEARIANILERGGRVVIDDLRFVNEYHCLINQSEASMWFVTRPDQPQYAAHPSEGLLSAHPFDEYVINHGTIHELQGLTSGIVEQYAMKSKG